MRTLAIAGVSMVMLLALAGTALRAEAQEGTTATTPGAKVLRLENPRLEFGPVVSLSPKVLGTGGAVSYRVAETNDRASGVWADLGLLRYDQEIDLFAGLSTNLPVGRGKLAEKTRLGAGYLLEAGAVFLYTRATVSW